MIDILYSTLRLVAFEEKLKIGLCMCWVGNKLSILKFSNSTKWDLKCGSDVVKNFSYILY